MNSQNTTYTTLKDITNKIVINFVKYIRFPVSWSLDKFKILKDNDPKKELIQGYLFFTILVIFCINTNTSFVFTPFIYASQYIEILFTFKLPEYSILEVNNFVYEFVNSFNSTSQIEYKIVTENHPIRCLIFLTTPILLVKLLWILRHIQFIIFTSLVYNLILKSELVNSEYFKLSIVISSILLTLIFFGIKFKHDNSTYWGVFPSEYRIKFILKKAVTVLIILFCLDIGIRYMFF